MKNLKIWRVPSRQKFFDRLCGLKSFLKHLKIWRVRSNQKTFFDRLWGLKFFLKHLKIWRIRSRQKFFSTGLNTFTAKQFSENHRFSLKIFKTLEGHNSLNFGRRRKFQTFLESSDKNLSKKWRFVSSYLNQKNVQSWKREKSPKTSILDEISRLGTERVNEVRWKIYLVLKRVFFDQATSKNNF